MRRTAEQGIQKRKVRKQSSGRNQFEVHVHELINGTLKQPHIALYEIGNFFILSWLS